MPELKSENLADLLDLLEAEAKPILGREEATTHIGIKKKLIDKISALCGEYVFNDINPIDEVEIKKRIEVIRNKLRNNNLNA